MMKDVLVMGFKHWWYHVMEKLLFNCLYHRFFVEK
jgi:hypothetical protein